MSIEVAINQAFFLPSRSIGPIETALYRTYFTDAISITTVQ